MIRSRIPRLAGLLPAVGGLLLLAACEDPSGVGLSVIDFGETDPNAQTVVAEASLDSLTKITGHIRPPAGAFEQLMIAGRAEDPVYGTIVATAYVHVARPLNIPPGFFVSEIEGAFLELTPSYVYGDTTQTATIDLHEVTESWNANEFTSDTTLQTDEKVVTTFTVSAADTLVRVPMPEKWIERRDTLLRSENFEQVFHGFQLRPRAQSQLAVGFEAATSLGVLFDFGDTAEQDTVRLISSAVATSVTRDLGTGHQPDQLFPVQDKSGFGLSLEFRLDTLDSPVISAGFIRVEADTLLLEANRPVHFVRPIARTLALYGLGEEGQALIAAAEFDEQEEAYVFSSTLLNLIFQDMALNRSPFDRLAIGFPRGSSSLNVAPLVTTPDGRPRAILLVVPANL